MASVPQRNQPYLKPAPAVLGPIDDPGFETVLAHWADDRDGHDGAAAPPIYQSSTFLYPSAAAFDRRQTPEGVRHDYSRVSNPTTVALEAKLAKLEQGAYADCFGSGMGAISAAINACVQAGDHAVCLDAAYGPARRYLAHLKRFGVDVTFVPATDFDAITTAIRPQTKLLYLESPTSGRFEVPDVSRLAAMARERGVTTIFDNSWATPYFFTPLEHGVDLVVHSVTKYLNGHSDTVAGVLVGRDEELRSRIWTEVELCGAMLDPFAAWLITRGLRTLAVRMRQHHESGLAVARWLAGHPAVERVNHPGLPQHPDHETASRQFRGYSGLFSFVPKEQSREATHRVIDRLRLFQPAVSWGGHESLAIGGTFFSAPGRPPEWLIRLSVGLETTDDLIADLEQALAPAE